MKKIFFAIWCLVVIACLFLFIQEVKAASPVVALPLLVAGSTSAVPVFLGPVLATNMVLSPYWIMFIENPDCRKEATISDLSKCVQSKSKKK